MTKNKGWDISVFGYESEVKTTDNFRAKYVRKYLESYKKYHFHDTSKNSPFSKMIHISCTKREET